MENTEITNSSNCATVSPHDTHKDFDTDRMEQGSEDEEESIKLLSDHSQVMLKLASEHRHRRKMILRRKLHQLRMDIKANREHGLDPLLIFPEEIWLMILGDVSDLDDLANCSKICSLFKRLVGSDHVTLLFVKVLPMLTSILGKQDILHCRLVCRKWCTGVDKFLESYFVIKKPPNGVVEQISNGNERPLIRMNKFEFWYKIADAKQHQRYAGQHYKIRKKIKRRHRNPFIGRSVRIMTERPVTDMHIFSVFNKLFWEFGSHIWHLNLTDGFVSLSPATIYSLCLQSLISCQNLRSLHLDNWQYTNWSIPEEEQVNIFNAKPLPPSHAHLECLTISIKNPNIFLLQDKLVEKYSGQLKRLEVHYWNSEIYHNFNWDNLLELFVVQGNSVELLESLHRMSAPVLRELSICLDKSGPRLESIIQLTHHFPGLQHLNLKFKDTFCGFSDQEVVSLPTNLIASSTLSTLEFTYSYSVIGFNFLVCFPLVKVLIIKKGHLTSAEHYLHEGNLPRRYVDPSRIYLEDDPEFNFEQEYEDSDDEDDLELNPGIEHEIGLGERENDDEVDAERYNGERGDEDQIVRNADDDGDEESGNEEADGEDGGEGGDDEDASEDEDEEDGSEEEYDDEQDGDDGEEISLLELGAGGYHSHLEDGNREHADAGNNIKEHNEPLQNDGDAGVSSEHDGESESVSETESTAFSEDNVVYQSAKTNKRCMTSNFVQIAKNIPSAYNDHYDVRMYSSNIWDILPSLQAVKIYVPTPSFYPAHDCYVYTRSGWLWERNEYLTRVSARVELVQLKTVNDMRNIKAKITRKLRNRRNAIANSMRAVGRDPLTLFSEKIWKRVLQNVNDVHDIADCAKACPLFAKILKDTRQQWLFGSAFVFLYAKLERKDILTRRQVCQKWCSGVDDFIQSFHITDRGEQEDDQPYTGLEIQDKLFEFEYTFNLPYNPMSANGYDKVINEMRDHRQNPFIGRNVALSIGPSAGSNVGDFYGEFNSFLRSFGEHIWHLKLFCVNECSPVITPMNYFCMILQILKACRNLRSLCLSQVSVDWKSIKKYDLDEQICEIEIERPKHAYLVSLTMNEANPKFMSIQRSILEKYAGQLCRVNLSLWHDDDYWCSSLIRRGLRELVLAGPKCRKWLGSYQGLAQMTSKNLIYLQIRLDGNEPKLQHVMQLTNHCPKLERLSIEFTQSYPGFSNDELVHLSSDALFLTSSLKSLEFTVSNKWRISLDFLISFPHLKRLCIRYVKRDEDGMVPDGPLESNFIQTPWAFPKCQYDNLDAWNVYSSNIWEVLRRLEFLIFENTRPEILEFGQSKIFSRSGYEYFKRAREETQSLS